MMSMQTIINNLKSFERPHDEFTLGVSFGHLLVNSKDLTAVNYSDENGSKSLLERLIHNGWKGITEDDVLVGAENGAESVVLGLGGQVNWRFKEFSQVQDLERAYLAFIEGLFEELKRRGQILLATGHQPVSSTGDIEIVPTPEYQALAQWAAGQGDLLEALATGAETTIGLQYAHVDNFQKRIQSAALVQPALAAFFDNASWVNGEKNTELLYNLRRLLTADERSYAIPGVLNDPFKYQDYANFVWSAPAVFVRNAQGLVVADDRSVGDVFADREMTDEDLERVYRMIHPSLTVSRHGLTLANIDSVPYPLNMAYVLLVKSLLYNPDHITALEKMIEQYKIDQIEAMQRDILDKGLDASFGDGTVFDLVKDLYFMVSLTVEPLEQHYLQPLNSLLFKNVRTKDVGARQFAAMTGRK